MKFIFTPYTADLRSVYQQIQEHDHTQFSSEFSIPEQAEGENGYVAFCKEEEQILAAISAVTFDQKQYFLSFWRDPSCPQLQCRILYSFLEGRLRLVVGQSVILSGYLSSHCKEDLFVDLFKRYRYTKTIEETVMEWDLVSTPAPVPARGSRILLKPCQDHSLLEKLHQSIFATDKWNAAAYVDSVLKDDDDNLQMYVIYEITPPLLPLRHSCSLKPVGMCGLHAEERSACLFSFGILPEKRRQGLALEALEQIRLVLPQNCTKLLVQVSGANEAAIGLYETYGFQKTEHVDLYEKHLFVF